MKRLHGLTLRMLAAPILGWFATLMFLLLMQFLIKYIPDLAGKGIPIRVILELIVYNLAYMVVLAVPMSMLIGTMTVFGRFSESRAYAVAKASGISPLRIVWPTLVVGLLVAMSMVRFNNHILPEANFRARTLWYDIRQKRPDFELRPGVFYQGINRYSLLVQHICDDGTLEDVLIYDYTNEDRSQVTIKAARGTLRTIGNRPELEITLFDGEIHRLITRWSHTVGERYERLAFDRYRMRLDLSSFAFERTLEDRIGRSDRTMRTSDMVLLVDSLRQSIDASIEQLAAESIAWIEKPFGAGDPEADALATTGRNGPLPTGAGSDPLPTVTGNGLSPTAAEGGPLPTGAGGGPLPASAHVNGPGAPIGPDTPLALTGIQPSLHDGAYLRALEDARRTHTIIEDARRTISWKTQRANRFRVEIHKKYSIAAACLIFVLIGAPLGLGIRRGSLTRVGLSATGIFLFYWVTLVQGGKAGRSRLPGSVDWNVGSKPGHAGRRPVVDGPRNAGPARHATAARASVPQTLSPYGTLAPPDLPCSISFPRPSATWKT